MKKVIITLTPEQYSLLVQLIHTHLPDIYGLDKLQEAIHEAHLDYHYPDTP